MNDLRLEVSVDDQTLKVFRGENLERTYPVSTAAKGVGFTPGSFRTPTGRFVIAQKIGGGQPAGTIFVAREPVGLWQAGEPSEKDLVLTRIIRLSGLAPENANSFDRFIYIHGTNHEDKLGTPASCGCIRLSNADVIELYELVQPGMIVEILPPLRKRGKLAFMGGENHMRAARLDGIDMIGGGAERERIEEEEDVARQLRKKIGEKRAHARFVDHRGPEDDRVVFCRFREYERGAVG